MARSPVAPMNTMLVCLGGGPLGLSAAGDGVLEDDEPFAKQKAHRTIQNTIYLMVMKMSPAKKTHSSLSNETL